MNYGYNKFLRFFTYIIFGIVVLFGQQNIAFAETTSTTVSFLGLPANTDVGYLTTRNASAGDDFGQGNVNVTHSFRPDLGANVFRIRRGFLNFKNILEGVTISSSSIVIRKSIFANADGDFYAFYAYTGTASTSTFSAADYSKCGSVAFSGNITYETTGYVYVPINQQGLDYLNSGNRGFCVQSVQDVSATQPTGENQQEFYTLTNPNNEFPPFILYEYELTTPPTAGVINFLWPVDSTSTPNFAKWYMTFNTNSTTTKNFQIILNYGLSPTNLNFFDFWPRVTDGTFGVAGFLDLNVFVFKHITFFDGETWYAKASLISEDGLSSTLEDETDLIIFTIDNDKIIPISAITNSTSTRDTSSAADTISHILQGILPPFVVTILPEGSTSTAKFICDNTPTSTIGTTIAFLFCPTGTSMDFISEQFGGFKNVFPFSIVHTVINTTKNVASTTQQAQNLTLSTDFYGDITVLSTSTLSAFVGQTGKDLIFNVEEAFAWFIVAFSALGIVFTYFKRA